MMRRRSRARRVARSRAGKRVRRRGSRQVAEAMDYLKACRSLVINRSFDRKTRHALKEAAQALRNARRAVMDEVGIARVKALRVIPWTECGIPYRPLPVPAAAPKRSAAAPRRAERGASAEATSDFEETPRGADASPEFGAGGDRRRRPAEQAAAGTQTETEPNLGETADRARFHGVAAAQPSGKAAAASSRPDPEDMLSQFMAYSRRAGGMLALRQDELVETRAELLEQQKAKGDKHRKRARIRFTRLLRWAPRLLPRLLRRR